MTTTKRRPSRSISESQRFSRNSMKNNLTGPLVATLVLIVLAAFYSYMFYQNNLLEKKVTALQATVVDNSQTVSAVVTYINNSLNQAQVPQNN